MTLYRIERRAHTGWYPVLHEGSNLDYTIRSLAELVQRYLSCESGLDHRVSVIEHSDEGLPLVEDVDSLLAYNACLATLHSADYHTLTASDAIRLNQIRQEADMHRAAYLASLGASDDV